MSKHFFGSIATIVGFVIGAGILGIPYAISKSGFITGVLLIVVLGTAGLFLNLYTGEIALRTKGSHQLTGLAQRYFGEIGKNIMAFLMITSFYGALTAYIIKVGQFLEALLNPFIGGNAMTYSLVFFVLFAVMIYIGLSAVEKSELILVILFIAIIFIIFVFALPQIEIQRLSSFDITKFFIPFGVLIFAFEGIAAIAEVKEELKGNLRNLRKVIIIGSIIPIILYLVFGFVVIGATNNVTDAAIIGLKEVLGYKVFILGLVLGILTIATSFIALSIAVKEIFLFDYKMSNIHSSTLACFIPIITAIMVMNSGINDAFFKVLDISGTFGFGGITIFTIFLYFKSKKFGDRKPEYTIRNNFIGYIIIALFSLGIIYKVLEMIGIL